jgi:hypothetical protein
MMKFLNFKNSKKIENRTQTFQRKKIISENRLEFYKYHDIKQLQKLGNLPIIKLIRFLSLIEEEHNIHTFFIKQVSDYFHTKLIQITYRPWSPIGRYAHTSLIYNHFCFVRKKLSNFKFKQNSWRDTFVADTSFSR